MQNTTSFQSRGLRGIDQRWQPAPAAAATVRDMYWTAWGGWADSGGWKRIISGENTDPDLTGSNPFAGLGEILSLHWFAQHNGARQFTLYETVTGGRLYVFNGSTARSGSPGDIVTFADLTNVNGRYTPTGPSARTQSVSWGDRLYLINGYDQPLCLDGTKAEVAGFDAIPGAPQATYLQYNRTNYFDRAAIANGYSTGGFGLSLAPAAHYFTLDGFGLGPLGEAPDSDVGKVRVEGTDAGIVRRKCGYRYLVTFLNERGQESTASAPSNLVIFENGDTGRCFVWVSIPTGGDHVVARRVYRTRNMMDSTGNLTSLGYGEQFYFLKEIQDNVCIGFEDGVPDTGLADLFDELDFGLWPAGAKYLAVFKNTMFLAGQNATELRYSAPGYPEVYPPDNVIPIGTAASGDFAGFYATKNALVVLKHYGIYLVKGDPASGFHAETLTEDTGCAAPNSLREVPGLGVVFLSDGDVWLLEGALENTGTPTGVRRISAPIPDHMDRLNRSALLNACGEVYTRDREYWLAVPTLGTTSNNRVLVYHYDIGEWSYRDGFPIACMRVSKDHRGYLFFGSNDTAAANVGLHAYSRGFINKNGTAVASLYETAHLDFGSVYHSVQPVSVNAWVVGYGNNDATLNVRVNRERDERLATDKTADQQDPNDTYPVYNTAVWDTDRWSVHRPVVVRFDIAVQSRGPVRELQLAFAPSDRRFELVGYDIECALGLQRTVTPLSTALAPPQR